MKTMYIALSCILLLLVASAAFAAPAILSFQNRSTTTAANYAATCSIVGILDNTDKINDNKERIYLPSLRTFALSKAGQANYSTALNTKGQQFRIACVRTDSGADHPVKMYFDRVSTYWMNVVSGIFRFY